MVARYAYGSVMHLLGAKSTPIDDPKEKQAFHDRALAELCNGVSPVALKK
jgi:hypothetical protein